MSYPIERHSDRALGAEWHGEVFVCDIDRTYLATRFSSLRGLARIPFEFAIDKREIDGMVALLKEVRRGPNRHSRSTPLYFVSASPAQLRPVIERKMLLDGLEFDGTTFKDWVGVLRQLRPSRLREQLGFKLTALLAGRAELPAGAQEVLIGDDLENDVLAFALYADLLARRLSREQALRVMRGQGVLRDDALAICAAAQRARGQVRAGFIRMERFSEPEAFVAYAPHLAACRSPFQMALGLFEAGSVGLAGVERVGQDLRGRGISMARITFELVDAVQRGLMSAAQGAVAAQALSRAEMPVSLPATLVMKASWAAAFGRAGEEPWTPSEYWR
jgi:hypothetical protein